MGEVLSTLLETGDDCEMVVQRNQNGRYVVRDVGVGDRVYYTYL